MGHFAEKEGGDRKTRQEGDIYTSETERVSKRDRGHRAAIQERGSILAWIVILSVYGADTIAETKLLISPFCDDLLIYDINYWVFKTILIYIQ